MKKLVFFFMFIYSYIISNAHAIPPTEDVKKKVDEVVNILMDPQYKPEAMKKSQRDKLWEIIKDAFNYKVMSQRAIASNWKKFSREEKKEFVALFTQLLSKIYIKTLQDKFSGERFIFYREVFLVKNKAIVKSKMLSDAYGTIPIDYSLILTKKGKWIVYDIKVEGVSLVKNYRTQFNVILKKKSPAQLIEILKIKLIEKTE